MEDHFTITQQSVFWLKSRLLIIRRSVQNAATLLPHHKPLSSPDRNTAPLHEIRTPLYTETSPQEAALQLGKIQNLRVAAKFLDGLFIRRGDVFSFWRQVGRPTRAKGFVVGRELRQGCLIPTVAGGICQLSNSLYQVAKRANMEILERHGHSQQIESSPFPAGEDATVFWNYVDLRFRATRDVILTVKLTQTELVVRLDGANGG